MLRRLVARFRPKRVTIQAIAFRFSIRAEYLAGLPWHDSFYLPIKASLTRQITTFALNSLSTIHAIHACNVPHFFYNTLKNIVLTAGWLLLGTSVLPAQHTYRILNDERESLQCRIDQMQQADQEILLTTFIIKDDLIGRSTLQMLIDAAERGVQVRMIVDDLGNRLPSDLLAYLAERGVENRIFNITRYYKFRTMVDRMHGKMLITDQRQFIIGGRNLKEEYYNLDSTSNFLDREVYVRDTGAVGTARRHFYDVWNYPRVSGKKEGKLTDERRSYWRKSLREAPGILRQRLRISLESERKWHQGAVSAKQPVHFIHDGFYEKKGKKTVRRRRKDHQCTEAMLALIAGAQRTIDIENAYFIPTRSWTRALKAAHKRGVRLRLLTNSGYTSDVPMVQAVYQMKRGRYKRWGVEIWEFRGQKMVHTKAFVIDSAISLIGSYNLESKSQNFNTEVAAWVKDPRLAAEHTRLMENNLQRSVQFRGKVKETRADVPPLTKIQKKRQRKANFFQYTLAPLASFFI